MNETIGSVIGYSNIETDEGDIVTTEFLRVMGGAIQMTFSNALFYIAIIIVSFLLLAYIDGCMRRK